MMMMMMMIRLGYECYLREKKNILKHEAVIVDEIRESYENMGKYEHS